MNEGFNELQKILDEIYVKKKVRLMFTTVSNIELLME